MLMSTEDVYFDSGLGITKHLQAAGVTMLKPAAFEHGNFKAAVLSEIKRSGIRMYADDCCRTI